MYKVKKYIFVVGPTSSGKSDLAYSLSKILKRKSLIINADNLQMYDELKLITNRPWYEFNKDNFAICHLYGCITYPKHMNVALWIEKVESILNSDDNKDYVAIIVGGNGFYVKSFIEGISKIPFISDNIKNQVKEKESKSTLEEFRNWVYNLDPLIKNKIFDKRRLCKFAEIKLTTGDSLLNFKVLDKNKFSCNYDYKMIAMIPPREILYSKINSQFQSIINRGAILEVEKLIKIGIPDDFILWKALGVKEIRSFHGGNCTLQEAINKAQQSIRNYAKRQLTWIRNQFNPDLIIENQDWIHNRSLLERIRDVLKNF